MDVAIAAGGAILGAALGFALAGDAIGTVAGIPGGVAGVILTIRGQRRARAAAVREDEMRDEIRTLRENVPVTGFEKRLSGDLRRQEDYRARVTSGRQDGPY